MNIGQLRKFVNLLPDDEETNNQPLVIQVEYGYGCSMVVTDVDCDLSTQYDPDTEEDYDCLVFKGEEDSRYCE